MSFRRYNIEPIKIQEYFDGLRVLQFERFYRQNATLQITLLPYQKQLVFYWIFDFDWLP